MSTTRLERLLAMLSESPSDSFLLFAVAKEYEGLENGQEALAYYRQLVASDPDYVGVYYHLGKLLEEWATAEDALEVYDQGMAIARKQNDQHAYNELAGAKLNCEMG